MAIFLVLERTGFFQILFKKKNGENGNGRKDTVIELLQTQFKTMQENHTHEMHEISESLKKISERMDEIRDYTRDSFQILDSRGKSDKI